MNLFETLQGKLLTKELKGDELEILDRLVFIRMQTSQRVPEKYEKAYGSEILVYAHLIGGVLDNIPGGLSIEDAREAVETCEGQCKDAVLQALNYVEKELETNRDVFLRWASIEKV